jgi:hypothetical protein
LRRVRPLTLNGSHGGAVGMAVGPCGDSGPGPWPWPKSHRLIQVAGGGTHSTPMKNLCVCGKTVKVTDRKWASKTVRVKVALWRDSREKVKVPDPRKSYPQPMVRPKWFRAWLRVRSSSTEVCPSCRRPQFCTAFRVRIPGQHAGQFPRTQNGIKSGRNRRAYCS